MCIEVPRKLGVVGQMEGSVVPSESHGKKKISSGSVGEWGETSAPRSQRAREGLSVGQGARYQDSPLCVSVCEGRHGALTPWFSARLVLPTLDLQSQQICCKRQDSTKCRSVIPEVWEAETGGS